MATPKRDPRAYMITRDGLCIRWDISRATTYRYQREGYLPKPVRLGPGAARWPLAEIEEIERRAAADRGIAP
jgi:predicted DNA-binding transcriptional regulator AlpA